MKILIIENQDEKSILVKKALENIKTNAELSNNDVIKKYDFEECDLAIFYGSFEKIRADRFSKAKYEVILNRKNFIVLETPPLLREAQLKYHESSYFRVGLNGHLGKSPFHYSDNKSLSSPLSSQDLKLLKVPILNKKGPIYVILQNPGDVALEGKNIQIWAIKIMLLLIRYGKRNIVFRCPPLTSNFRLVRAVVKPLKLVNIKFEIGTNENKLASLSSASAVITYSSTMAIDALMNECPSFCDSAISFGYGYTPSLISYLKNEVSTSDYKILELEHYLKSITWSIESFLSSNFNNLLMYANTINYDEKF